VGELRPALRAVEEERDQLRAEFDEVLATRAWRYAQVPRRAYARLRQLIARG
jgi:hypothetical protein